MFQNDELSDRAMADHGLIEGVTSGPEALSLVATTLSSSITPGTRAARAQGGVSHQE